MSLLDFPLPENLHRLNLNKKEDVLFFANRIAAICFGEEHLQSPPLIRADGSINIYPKGNNFWLHPPNRFINQPKGCWRLKARHEDKEGLQLIVDILALFK